LLGITENYLYRVEKGISTPSLQLSKRIAEVIGVSVESLLDESKSKTYEDEGITRGARVLTDIMNKLSRERHGRSKAEKYSIKLEQRIEHLEALIELHMQFDDVRCDESLSKGETAKKLETLAEKTSHEGEITFNEILTVLRVKRSVLKNWLISGQRPYKCKLFEKEVMASSPGEAALRLLCFDCEEFESHECSGYGNEKRPENLIILLLRLEVNGIYNRAEQSQILDESYGIKLSPHSISEMIYRSKIGLPLSEDLLNLDNMTSHK
jgi:transcriptional regulator with XRE-family HTH domain